MRRIDDSKLCPILGAKIMSQTNEELPVIVQLAREDAKLEEEIKNLSTKVNKGLHLIKSIACNLNTNTIYRLASNPDIDYISFDYDVYALLDIGSPAIEANFPYQEGYRGQGVTIAVIDTGISPHQDFTRPKNRIVGFKDFINDKTNPYDDNGHGTHVSGIIAGNGYASRGKYTGIAPEANILAIKALNDKGSAKMSDIISALEYTINTKDEYNTKVLNLSFGGIASSSYSKDPLCKAVKQVKEAGLIIVVAAGNSGPKPQTIATPGISPDVITVGAVDNKRTVDTSDDEIASFSSRGPTNDGLIKPDIVAPGVNINSLSHKELNGYRALSGTSMATPFVTGSIALLINKYGSLSTEQVRKEFVNSCIDLKASKEDQGAGLVNLQKLFYKKPDKNIVEKRGNKKESDFEENILTLFLILYLLNKDM